MGLERVNVLSPAMKKWVIIGLGIVIAFAITFYKDPAVKSFLQRQSDNLLPEQITHNKAYRWKDEKGNWHVSDRPPANGIDYEEVHYHRDTNVIPSEQLTGKSKQ